MEDTTTFFEDISISDVDVVVEDDESTQEIKNKENLNNNSNSILSNKVWENLLLSKALIKGIKQYGYGVPTKIQLQSIPIMLEGKDVLLSASTGSGKTAAYLIPAIERLLRSPIIKHRKLNDNGTITNIKLLCTKVLVILPTRELASQCYIVCDNLCKYTPITRLLLSGGINIHQQEQDISKQPDIIISTPGRCLDLLLNTKAINFDLLNILIFDEADKLIDQGFNDVCLSIVKECYKNKQTILVSATVLSKKEELCRIALNNPKTIALNKAEHNLDSLFTKCSTIMNEFVSIDDESLRYPLILKLLEDQYAKGVTKILVFINTKKNVHKIRLTYRQLDLVFKFNELHADLDQDKRNKVLKEYLNNEVTIIISTDLLSRGIDLPELELVINGEVPDTDVKFLHRIGRTGRAGRNGLAITIFNQATERSHLKQIFKAIKSNKNEKFNHIIQYKKNDLEKYLTRFNDASYLANKAIRLEEAEKKASQALHRTEKLIYNKFGNNNNNIIKRTWIAVTKQNKLSKPKHNQNRK